MDVLDRNYAKKLASGIKSITVNSTNDGLLFITNSGTRFDVKLPSFHSHSNLTILDKFSYDSTNNLLLYDGKPIVSGSSGTTNYVDLTNKPSINGVELSGNKTLTDLGITNYDDTQVKSDISDLDTNKQDKTDNALDTTDKTVTGAINEINGNSLDNVTFSADYKNIIINRKSGLNPYTIPIASIIHNAKIIELNDVDSTDIGDGKTLVYDGATQKHKYVDSTGTDEFVKMDGATDAKHLSDLIDKQTIVNDNGVLKVKKLDGQNVTIAEINHLKGLTMNVMDLVNAFANGGVKVLNTPVNTHADLSTLDRSTFLDGISYIVYVLADETHSGAKTTYLCNKTSETFFGNADGQRNFVTDPIDLANEVTGKLGTANIDVDALWKLLTINDTYKTLTTKNEPFGTHGAKALYDELVTSIGKKANATDLTTHTNDTDIHITAAERDKWNAKLDNIGSDIDLEELSLNDTIFPLANDETAQLIVTKNFDSPITYKSSDESIATVSETGLITKLANGEATITVEAGPKSTTAKVVNLITKNSNVLPLLNIPYLHSRGIKGQGVKVAIFEDLVKSSEEFTIAGWYDFSTGTYSDTQPNPSDYNVSLHTNHMTTFICGKTRGVAPDCEFYNLYPSVPCDSGDVADCFMRCVDFCIEHGIRVINDSIGFDNIETCIANYRAAYKKAYDNNIIIVSSLGNADKGQNKVADENLWMLTANSLNIGACEKDGSHRSNTCIGRCMMFNNYGFDWLQTWDPNRKYKAGTNKTSGATALTTGCVALLLCQDPTLTARQIYHILKDNAIQHTDYIQGEWNQYYGWGRINVPVLSNIKVKSDEECRLLDSEIEIVNTDVVISNGTKGINLQPNAEGEYDVNVNDMIYISPIITPVEKDLYLSESITSNDNMLHYSNGYINTFQCCKPGKCEITIIFKGISLQKKCIFNISE